MPRFLILLVLSFSAAMAAAPLAASPVRSLSFCFDGRGALPWYGADGQGEAISRLDAIAAARGLRFDYQPMAEEDCHLAVANGRVDGALGLVFRDDLQWVGAFPPEAPADRRRALFTEGLVLVRRIGAPVDIDGGALVGLRTPLAVVAGSEAAREFRGLGVRIDDRNRNARSLLERVARAPAGVAALGWGEARAVLSADTELAARLEIVPRPLRPRGHHLVFSRQFLQSDATLAEGLWSALAETAMPAPAGETSPN